MLTFEFIMKSAKRNLEQCNLCTQNKDLSLFYRENLNMSWISYYCEYCSKTTVGLTRPLTEQEAFTFNIFKGENK